MYSLGHRTLGCKKKSNSLLADCSVKTVSALQNVFLMHFENTAWHYFVKKAPSMIIKYDNSSNF